MKIWHVLTKERWIVVRSEKRPEGSLVHVAKDECLKWACGWAK